MNLSREQCAVFVTQGWQEGLAQLCQSRAELADKILRNANPLDSVAIAKAQAALTIYEKDIPSIAREVNEFLREQQTPPATGVK